jgi:hypothetical protein
MSSDLGRYRKLFTRIWVHPGFTELTDFEKVLAVWLLTGPQSNRIGLYRLSPAQAAEEFRTSPERFKKGFVTVTGTFNWLFDSRAKVVYIPSWWRWNPPANANVIRGSLKDLNDIPPCAFIDAFATNIEWIPQPLLEPFMQGLREQLPQGYLNQEQEQEKKLNQETPALRAVPTKTALNGTGNIDPRVLEQASIVIRSEGQGRKNEYLIDALQERCRNLRIDVRHTEAAAALIVCRESKTA